MSSDVLEELQQCVNKMQQLFAMEYMKSQSQKRPTNRNFQRSSQSRKQLTCLSYGEAENIRRNCKKGPNKVHPLEQNQNQRNYQGKA